MDNKMRKILIQLGASYELAGRKLTDDTLLGAAKEIYDTIEINEDEVEILFRKARVIADIPTIRVLNEAYKLVCKERQIKNALPPPESERLSKEEWYDMCKQIAAALKGV